MGVGRHLLICITTDTLLDQVNGARNNKGGGGSLGGLGGALRPSFLASNTHTVLGSGGQASCSQLGGHPIPASHIPKPQTPQCCLLPSSEPTPHTLPSPENPVPGAPLLGVVTPAMRPAPLSHRACPRQGPDCPSNLGPVWDLGPRHGVGGRGDSQLR